MQANGLRLCPMCKGSAELSLDTAGSDGQRYVYCTNCRLQTRPMPGLAAMALWNQRIDEPLNDLAKAIIKINTANGWNVTEIKDWRKTYKVPAIVALIHSEASEALEAFRGNDRDNFKEELADIIIRVLDLSGGLQIDIDRAVAAKLEVNQNRPYRHGGKRV